MSAVPALRAEGLSKRFSTTLAVDDLDLTVPPGEVFGFLGPNGAGKSTTIRMVLGLLRPSAGAAWVFGEPVAEVERGAPSARLRPGRRRPVALLHRPGVPGPHGRARAGHRPDLPRRARPPVRTRHREACPRLLERQPAEGGPRRRLRDACPAARARRADERPRSADGAGVPPLHRARRSSAGRRSSSARTSSPRSRRSASGSASCAAGRLVEVAGMSQLRRLRRTEVVVDLARPAPELDRLADLPGVADLRRTSELQAQPVAHRAARRRAARPG